MNDKKRRHIGQNIPCVDLTIISLFYVKVISTINVNFHLIDELMSFYLIPYITFHIFICSSLFRSCIIMTVNHKKRDRMEVDTD